MKLEFLKPLPELEPYVTKIWAFENNTGLINHGTLIAPNARCKIIISYKNILTTTDNKRTAICNEGDICFIGLRDVPVTLGSPAGATGSIGIELTTAGAYRFLNIPLHEIANNLFSFETLYGNPGKRLLEKVIDSEEPKQKLNIVQGFLIDYLSANEKNNSIVDYAVNYIWSSHGLAPVKELERKLGYSRRYLDLLFKEHLGISPKTLCTIARFQSFFKYLTLGEFKASGKIADLYYDQSHFIKEFKRYTGFTPTQYTTLNNDFGKNF